MGGIAERPSAAGTLSGRAQRDSGGLAVSRAPACVFALSCSPYGDLLPCLPCSSHVGVGSLCCSGSGNPRGPILCPSRRFRAFLPQPTARSGAKDVFRCVQPIPSGATSRSAAKTSTRRWGRSPPISSAGLPTSPSAFASAWPSRSSCSTGRAFWGRTPASPLTVAAAWAALRCACLRKGRAIAKIPMPSRPCPTSSWPIWPAALRSATPAGPTSPPSTCPVAPSAWACACSSQRFWALPADLRPRPPCPRRHARTSPQPSCPPCSTRSWASSPCWPARSSSCASSAASAAARTWSRSAVWERCRWWATLPGRSWRLCSPLLCPCPFLGWASPPRARRRAVRARCSR